jgi:hypothetical protein
MLVEIFCGTVIGFASNKEMQHAQSDEFRVEIIQATRIPKFERGFAFVDHITFKVRPVVFSLFRSIYLEREAESTWYFDRDSTSELSSRLCMI